MVNFVTVRTTPDGTAQPRYRNLLRSALAEVYQYTDGKYYLRGTDDKGNEFFFGDPAGYATQDAATTAMLAVLP